MSTKQVPPEEGGPGWWRDDTAAGRIAALEDQLRSAQVQIAALAEERDRLVPIANDAIDQRDTAWAAIEFTLGPHGSHWGMFHADCPACYENRAARIKLIDALTRFREERKLLTAEGTPQ